MTKKKFLTTLLSLFAVVFLAIATFFAPNATFAKADWDDDDYYDPSWYTFDLANYDVTYEINSDRSMHVTEVLDVHFTGSRSTGLMRDIPINAGDRVRNVKVYNSDKSDAVYDVYVEYENFLTVDIGDSTNKTGKTVGYILEYDYIITNPQNNNAVYLNAVGYGWECSISDVDVTLVLPEGFLFDKSELFVGSTQKPFTTSCNFNFATNTLTYHYKQLSKYEGITFNLFFNPNTLSVYTDLTSYFALAIGLILIAVAAAVKYLKFNTEHLTPVVNFTAPDGMDPLVVGKYIDNVVDGEDITSLLYYWADKGYIKIDMSNAMNPVLIRIHASLPEGSPQHQKIMYNSLFAKGEMVKVSSLANKFYTTVDAVTMTINKKYKATYTNESTTIGALVALLGGVMVALLPLIFAFARISTKFLLFESFIVIIPIFMIYGATFYVNMVKLKQKPVIYKGEIVGISTIAVVASLLYAYIVPDYIVEFIPAMISFILGSAVAMISAFYTTRTDEYIDKLNGILGFKEFIEYAEKDRLEAMLEDDPQLFYHVLPYAQVLGVTDKWEKRFEGLTIAPPAWTTNPVGTYFEFRAFNHAMRAMNIAMASQMTSRPSSSGASGGHGGFGSGGGGGHGGGGGRGR